MTDISLTKTQITTLRRAAGLLYDLGNMELSAKVDKFVDELMGRKDDDQ